MGTFLYSAPEQTGMLKRPVDGRADLYALGVILFEEACGRCPFEGRDAAQLLQLHAVEKPPLVPSLNPAISPGLGLIIDKLLAKDPDDRDQTANSLREDLERIAEINAQLEAGGAGGSGPWLSGRL